MATSGVFPPPTEKPSEVSEPYAGIRGSRSQSANGEANERAWGALASLFLSF